MKRVIKYVKALLLSVALCCPGCKKWVEADPPVNSINGENIYNEDVTAAAVLTGIYVNMSNISLSPGDNLPGFLSLITGLMADELTLSPNTDAMRFYYRNALTVTEAGKPWTRVYQSLIYRCNDAIEGLNKSSTLTASVKSTLLGDAYFLRAFGYFYLTGLYGDVPLVVNTNHADNALLARAPQTDVYAQIISDLEKAKQLLPENFVGVDALTPATARITPCKAAAQALAARAYLYMGNWQAAEREATAVISQSDRFRLAPLSEVFLADSPEAIWQLWSVDAVWNTDDGKIFILPENGPDQDHLVYLSPQVLAAFETGDVRRQTWVGERKVGTATWYYPHKYKSAKRGSSVTEYKMVLRLGELYLIRAEARIRQNNLDGGKADMDALRQRAGLDPTGAAGSQQLLAAIAHERQVELFTEWGDRWLDMKRNKTIDGIMTNVTVGKGSSWKTTQQLLPIPADDILHDPNLKQNPGY